MQSSKKAQVTLGGLYAATLLIVTVGIAIGIGIFVLNETADATSTTAYSVTNETQLSANIDDAAGSTLSGGSVCGSQAFVISTVYNNSNTTDIFTSGNYTVDEESGVLTNLSGDRMGTNWNVTYTYTGAISNATTSACRALTTTGTGVGTFASWITVIVVVLAAAIVLGIVINSFSRTGRAAV